MFSMSDSTTTRLDRLEALAETVLLAIQQQQQQIDQNSRDIKESMVEVVDMLATLGQQIEENSTYIRGLQAENRNILSLLLEQRQQDEES